jgi:hypothetical protein
MILLKIDIRKNKFFRIFSALSKSKQQQFRIFLENQSENEVLIKFFIALEDKALYIDEFTINKQLIFTKTSPKAIFDDGIIRQYFFELNQYLEKFLLIEFNQRQFQFYSFVEIFYELGLEKEIQNNLNDWNKTLENTPKDHQNQFQRYNILQFTNELNTKKGKRDDGSISQQMMDTLDELYFSQKLRLVCIILNNKNIWEQKKEIILLNEIIFIVSKLSLIENPYIELYYFVYQLLTTEKSDELFQKSEEIILKNKDKIDRKSLREIFIILQNYCIRRLKEGVISYERKLFDIYKNQIELNLIVDKKIISPWTYKNIITISFRLNEFEWAKDFMTSYKGFLPEGERENAFNYNLANYYFRTGKYDNSMRLLHQLEFTDLFYKLGSKLILLKIYFELNEEEAFENHCTSFKNFLQREKKLNIEQRKPYLNQIKFSNLIFTNKHHRRNLNLIKEKIKSSSKLADIHWLLEQIDLNEKNKRN